MKVLAESGDVMRGKVLASWRKELGWSQERLAAELGVETQVVEDLESLPNITPLLEALLGTVRSALAAMKPAPLRDDIVARGPVVGGIVRARRA